MGFSSNFSLYFLLLLCILLPLSRVSGEGSVSGSDKNEFNGLTDNLGRGSKMFFGKTSNSSWGDLGSDFSGARVFNAFFASLSMVLVSEIGDETFIIAALMAMRQPKSIVLAGALSALFIMAVLSTGLGRIVPNLISRKHTNSVATVLYAFFGLRLLYYAWGPNSEDKNKKEMEEVEEKLESGKGKTPFRRFFSGFCTPIFLESFMLTFIAEWGDRSQIAMISLATNKNAVGVAVGAIVGHIVCTTLAVVGGSMLASKISQRLVSTMGGILFLGFSVSSFIFPPL